MSSPLTKSMARPRAEMALIESSRPSMRCASWRCRRRAWRTAGFGHLRLLRAPWPCVPAAWTTPRLVGSSWPALLLPGDLEPADGGRADFTSGLWHQAAGFPQVDHGELGGGGVCLASARRCWYGAAWVAATSARFVSRPGLQHALQVQASGPAGRGHLPRLIASPTIGPMAWPICAALALAWAMRCAAAAASSFCGGELVEAAGVMFRSGSLAKGSAEHVV